MPGGDDIPLEESVWWRADSPSWHLAAWGVVLVLVLSMSSAYFLTYINPVGWQASIGLIVLFGGMMIGGGLGAAWWEGPVLQRGASYSRTETAGMIMAALEDGKEKATSRDGKKPFVDAGWRSTVVEIPTRGLRIEVWSRAVSSRILLKGLKDSNRAEVQSVMRAIDEALGVSETPAGEPAGRPRRTADQYESMLRVSLSPVNQRRVRRPINASLAIVTVSVLLGGSIEYAGPWFLFPNDPHVMFGHDMAYDVGEARMVLFGGYDGDWLDETFVLDTGSFKWTKPKPPTNPGPRSGHALAYNPLGGGILLFGGELTRRGLLNDTWTYDVKSNRWSDLIPTSRPPPRQYGAMATDPTSGKVVLFGGQGAFGSLNDTWSYDARTNTWARLDFPGAPPPRTYHEMVFDPSIGRFLVYGEADEYVWLLDITNRSWEKVPTASGPGLRIQFGLAFEDHLGKTLLFGGVSLAGSLGDTWAFDGRARLWTLLSPSKAPRPRSDHAMASAGSIGVLLVGGWDRGFDAPDATWLFDGASWTAVSSTDIPIRLTGFYLGVVGGIGGMIPMLILTHRLTKRLQAAGKIPKRRSWRS